MDFAKALYELERENKVLAENPEYCLRALKGNLAWCLNRTEYAREELDYEELYKILHEEFAKKFSYSSAMLLPFLFSFIDNDKKIVDNEKKLNAYYVNIFNKLRFYFTATIFVRINKKMDKETIQLLSVSDDKALLTKPEWWQRNGTCHAIGSRAGKLETVAKAIVEGRVDIILSGPYVQNLKDKSKHLPYWINYSILIINDKKIFDEFTPVWHDKPYVYRMDVKSNEEIKIHVEW